MPEVSKLKLTRNLIICIICNNPKIPKNGYITFTKLEKPNPEKTTPPTQINIAITL